MSNIRTIVVDMSAEMALVGFIQIDFDGYAQVKPMLVSGLPSSVGVLYNIDNIALVTCHYCTGKVFQILDKAVKEFCIYCSKWNMSNMKATVSEGLRSAI